MGLLDWSALDGRLLLVHVHEIVPGVDVEEGTAEAVRADVTVLDGPGAGEEFKDIAVLPRVLLSQLRPAVGELVLARLCRGRAVAGRCRPWLLNTASEDDKRLGTAWVSLHV